MEGRLDDHDDAANKLDPDITFPQISINDHNKRGRKRSSSRSKRHTHRQHAKEEFYEQINTSTNQPTSQAPSIHPHPQLQKSRPKIAKQTHRN
jgi:hypothetical protein